MDFSWLTTTWSTVLISFLSAIIIYLALIMITRIVGLRSFSKFSSFDLAVTIAVGSVLGRALVAHDQTVLHTVTAVASLFILQITVDYFRSKVPFVSRIVDNKPFLLMKGPQMIEENLRKARITPKEIRHELRQANVTKLSQVKAVVLESTGEVSVLHHPDESHQMDEPLLQDVNKGIYN